ncbi:MAG: hypothetical protein LCI00_05565 [Chloroflexi bacterium]|nr:hypothetical protein [Chloroflexota bacterium]
MVEGEPAATDDQSPEDICKSYHHSKWQQIDNFTNDGSSTTAYWCPFCYCYRYDVEAVAE